MNCSYGSRKSLVYGVLIETHPSLKNGSHALMIAMGDSLCVTDFDLDIRMAFITIVVLMNYHCSIDGLPL
ncbi:hypothetical protein SAMN04488109_0700 [Chryseolinea serpens]|uniref:Uncharacterized protein n=1 Tax=Chryseolinea serpens TaxID=947013 RepID=A0A1M5KKM3_9BACT|nr:hypothetical protein SAMN04488109_0700 [Chryseolinea serpens]